MKQKTYSDGLKDAWELFNKRGISVTPDTEKGMFVTVSHGDSQDTALANNITFHRKSEPGILSWLPDREWQALKEGKLPMGVK